MNLNININNSNKNTESFYKFENVKNTYFMSINKNNIHKFIENLENIDLNDNEFYNDETIFLLHAFFRRKSNYPSKKSIRRNTLWYYQNI
ncbi:hypothetical protein NPX79_03480 [Spiroplasma endosymbiont of Anurida maritima]|uniref:hypothetical protein n=1 Tax=Spiroplasma endosymbiont of Anurida maritima TaxID=2967972 RepID=UPI0036D2A09C